jgi:hypothetical protein
MPTYTVRRNVKDLQEMCEEYNLVQVLSAPKIVSGTGSLTRKTDDGWKENLSRIKKGAGAGNTIKL